MSALGALRRLAQTPPAAEPCDFCAAPLGEAHAHLLDPGRRELRCACAACAQRFGEQARTRWRAVPPRVEALPGFELDDATWTRLGLPVDMTFFVRSSVAGRVVAFYPGPAGVVESALPLGAWADLEAACPALAALAPDVEAVLVDRRGGAHESYRVSIDECYRLVGLCRGAWRGLSGGPEIREALDGFFGGLRATAAARRA